MLPTLVITTLVAFAISFTFQRAVAAQTMEADSGFALTVWGLGLTLGPILAIWGSVLLALRRHLVAGRWLLGVGVLGIELFLAFSLVATQAGEQVF